MITFLKEINERYTTLGLAIELIPVVDFTLRKLEQGANLLVPNILKGNKRIVQDKITPILKNMSLAGALYRLASVLSASGKDTASIGYILSKELICLSYLREQHSETSINITVDPSEKIISGIERLEELVKNSTKSEEFKNRATLKNQPKLGSESDMMGFESNHRAFAGA